MDVFLVGLMGVQIIEYLLLASAATAAENFLTAVALLLFLFREFLSAVPPSRGLIEAVPPPLVFSLLREVLPVLPTLEYQ
jgi:hypothetical protein